MQSNPQGTSDKVPFEKGTVEASENAKICVFGVGDFGCDVLSKLKQNVASSVERIAINNDHRHLLEVNADRKIFMKEIPRGLGVCSNPVIGEEAARNVSKEIEEVLGGTDVVLLIAGLGGKIGSGASPVIAEIAKKQGSLVISLVSFPLLLEGKIRRMNAIECAGKLEGLSGTTLVIPMEGVMEVFQGLGLDNLFKVANEVMVIVARSMLDFLTRGDKSGVDYRVIRSVLQGGGMGAIGIGDSECSDTKGVIEATEEALSSPLLIVQGSRVDNVYVPRIGKFVLLRIPPKIINAKLALVIIISGEEKVRDELGSAMELVHKRIPINAQLRGLVSLDKALGNIVQILIIFSGIDLSQEFLEIY